LKNIKFATKLLLIILGVSIISMLAIISISYFEFLDMLDYSLKINEELGDYSSNGSQEALVKQAKSYLLKLSNSRANAYDNMFLLVQNNVLAMAGYMEHLYKNPLNFVGKRLPLAYEAANDGLPGASIMNAEGVKVTPDITREMLLVSNAEYMFANIYKTNLSLSNLYLGTESGIFFLYTASIAYDPNYDPRKRGWYLSAVREDGPIWSDAYADAFSGELCTTCSKVYYGADGGVAGVVAVDIPLSFLADNIHGVPIGEKSYAFLVNAEGTYIVHPLYRNAYELAKVQEQQKDILDRMVSEETGIQTVEIDNTTYLLAHTRLRTTGWLLGIVVEFDEIISDSLAMKNNIDEKTLYAVGQIENTLDRVFLRNYR
jgi:sigma-B regulation protein RsbU (phosphoserine phosphatase)